MSPLHIISSGTPGAESAALDAAIRFGIGYSGYTSQGALMTGDRPTGRYRLDERPFVNPSLLLKANIERSDGILIFSSGPMPPHMHRMVSELDEETYPYLHIDFERVPPRQAAFRIAAWVKKRRLGNLLITGPTLFEDRMIYAGVHEAMTCFFLLGNDDELALSGRTMH